MARSSFVASLLQKVTLSEESIHQMELMEKMKLIQSLLLRDDVEEFVAYSAIDVSV